MTEELVIDESNFGEYFFDARNHTPDRGQVMASYSAMADFVDTREKRHVINLLRLTENKGEAIAQVMRKLHHASEQDAYRVPKEMAQDMLSGMSEDECAAKPYKFKMEMFFYTEPQYVPVDDPHWNITSFLKPYQFLSLQPEKESDDDSDLVVSAKLVED